MIRTINLFSHRLSTEERGLGDGAVRLVLPEHNTIVQGKRYLLRAAFDGARGASFGSFICFEGILPWDDA